MIDEQDSIFIEIIQAGKSGTFLDFVYKSSRGSDDSRKQIVELLVSVHNAGDLDIVREFKQLNNSSQPGHDFFLTRHLFEKALPRLNAPVLPVMDCIQHLVNESGQDMSAGMLFPPFIEYCEAVPARVNEALGIILTSPEQWSGFLSPALNAGGKRDVEFYLQKAIDLSFYEDAAIRRNAVHALGSLKFPDGSGCSCRAMNCLNEMSEKENDDQVLSCLISSTSQICILDNSQTEMGVENIKQALSRGNSLSLHAASNIFAYETKNLPEEMLDVFLQFLLDVDPKHAGTVSNIGFGLTMLLKRDDPTKGIEFLESLLTRQHGKLTIESLDHLVHSIHDIGIVLLCKLLTRWFCTGDFTLCNSMNSILNVTHLDDILLEIDRTEIRANDPVMCLFVARKTIGFLFMKPVTCCSIIVSLMKNIQDEELIQKVGTLLFDPILLNFSGKPYDFLKEAAKNSDGIVRKAIQDSINAIDNYLEMLRTMPNIPEMFPSQEQREANIRHYNREIAESYKDAQKDSIFNLICSKSLLLYGNSSIMHIQDGSAQSRRMEIPMQHHSISMEVPRQGDVDPFTLDYTLRIFRNERIVSQ